MWKYNVLTNKRKTPRIKTDKNRTSKRFNLQNTDGSSSSSALGKSGQQQSSTDSISQAKSSNDENNIDERLEKNRRERELWAESLLEFVRFFF